MITESPISNHEETDTAKLIGDLQNNYSLQKY